MSDTAEHRVRCYQLATERRGKGKPSWDGQLNLVDIFHNDDLDFTTKRDQIVARIKHLRAYKDAKATPVESDDYYDAEELLNLVEELGDVETVSDFDGVWSAFYDWADIARIWIKTF